MSSSSLSECSRDRSIQELKTKLEKLYSIRRHVYRSEETFYIEQRFSETITDFNSFHFEDYDLSAVGSSKTEQIQSKINSNIELKHAIEELMSGRADDDQPKRLFIFGPKGCGKTETLLHLESELWRKFDPEKVGLVKQFVPFASNIGQLLNTGEVLKDSVLSHLNNIVDKDDLNKFKDVKLIPVWLLDGYDEMLEAKPLGKHLYECGGICVVSCRQEFLDIELEGDIHTYFDIDTTHQISHGEQQRTKVLYSMPNDLLQVKEFIQLYNTDSIWKCFADKEVPHIFKSSEYLFELITSNQYLKQLSRYLGLLSIMILQVPKLLKEIGEIDVEESKCNTIASPLERINNVGDGVISMKLLDAFFEVYFEHTSKSLRNFVGLQDHNVHAFPEICKVFCEDVAFCIAEHAGGERFIDFKADKVKAYIQKLHYIPAGCFKFLLQTLPMYMCSDTSRFAFMFEPIYFYFLARRSIRATTETLSQRLYSHNRSFLEAQTKLLSTHNSQVLQLFVDCVLQSRQRDIDEAQDSKKVIASSNALSVLNYGIVCGVLDFRFHDVRDWKNIRAPFSNLSCAQIFGCNFDEADLSNSLLFRAIIKSSSFRGTDLRGASIGPKIILPLHSEAVFCITISPDGKHLASSSQDKTIRIWDTRTFECVKVIGGQNSSDNERRHFSSVTNVLFSPCGETLVSSSFDRTVKLYSVPSYEVISSFKCATFCLCFSSDSQFLATATSTNVIVWQFRNGMASDIVKIDGKAFVASSLCFLPDSPILCAAHQPSQKLYFYNVESKQQETVSSNQPFGRIISVSPGGTMLAVGTLSNVIHLLDMTQNLERKVTFEGHSDVINCIVFNPKETLLASCSDDLTVKLWHILTGNCVSTFSFHLNNIRSICFTFDGSSLISCSMDSTIMISDLVSPSELVVAPSVTVPKSIVSFLDGCNSLLASNCNGFQCFETKTGRRLWKIEINSGEPLIFSTTPDSKCIFFALNYDSPERAEIRALYLDGQMYMETIVDQNCNIRKLCLNPQGSILAFSSADRSIKLWDVNLKRIVTTIQLPNSEAYAIQFNQAGDTLASLGSSYPCSYSSPTLFLDSDNSELSFWKATTGKLSETVTLSDTFYSFSFCLEGSKLAALNLGRVVILDTCSQANCISEFKSSSSSIAISSCGRLLAFFVDAMINVYDLEEQSILCSFSVNNKRMSSICFDKSGTYLASYSPHCVTIWNLETKMAERVIGTYGISLEFDSLETRVDSSLSDLIKVRHK